MTPRIAIALCLILSLSGASLASGPSEPGSEAVEESSGATNATPGSGAGVMIRTNRPTRPSPTIRTQHRSMSTVTVRARVLKGRRARAAIDAPET